MKKGIALLLAVGLALGFAACSGETSYDLITSESLDSDVYAVSGSSSDESDGTALAGEGIRLGICLPDRDQYWTTFEGSVVKAAEALGMDVQVVEASADISTQISQIEAFSNNGFDAVVVGLSSNGSYMEAIDAAGDMDVVFFNRMLTDISCLDGTDVIYVGMDEYDAGYAQGEWLAGYFAENEPEKTELSGVMFMGVLGQQSVADRTQGAKDALAAAGYTVNWVFEDTSGWNRADAMDKFTQFYGTGTEFDFVCSNNDEMALGVVEACSTLGVDIDFPIVGIDATEVGCNAVLAGTLSMTVNQNPILQGQIVADCVIDIINDITPDGCNDEFVYSTEAVVVTIDNVEDVMTMYY